MADDVLPTRIAELTDITTRIADHRRTIAATPLGRYRSGQQEAQAILDARDLLAITETLRAVTEDRDGDARAILDTLDADVVTALAERAGRLSVLATDAARGRR